MPHFKSNNFYQNRPKVKLFLQKKYKIFERWGSAPRPPMASGRWWNSSQTLNTAPPPLQISGYAPGTRHVLLILASLESYN